MRARARAGAGLLAVALAGCGGSEQSRQSAPTPTTSAAPATPVSTLSTSSLERAAQRYQELVAPANADIPRLVSAVEVLDWKGARAAAKRMLSSHRAVSLAVQEEAWPPSVQAAVDGFVEALTADLTRLQAVADADTEQEAWDAVQAYAREEETPPAVELLRHALGLPSAPLAVEESGDGAGR